MNSYAEPSRLFGVETNMKPSLRTVVLCVTFLLASSLYRAQDKTDRTTASPEELSAGFQCPGKDANQLRPNPKLKLGDVTKKAIQLPRPRYPQLAKAAGLHGNVKAEVVIEMNSGSVAWAQVISGHPLLKAAVRDVVCRARFVPTNVDGHAGGILSYRFARRR